MPAKTSATKTKSKTIPQEEVQGPIKWQNFRAKMELLAKEHPEWKLVMDFGRLPGPEKLREARKIITDTIIDAKNTSDPRIGQAIRESESTLRGYATLDDIHSVEITKLISQISSYLNDPSRKRPLNALMLASPGAGKSHFIQCVAQKMADEQVQAVTFNMATMQSAEDIAQPVDELRNVKVNDRRPLLFLDEFDSDPAWYATLLPLLWDGELQVAHRRLKLGKSVIVLAGSNPDLPKVMDLSGGMTLENVVDDAKLGSGKLVDLLSRINGGVIEIPDLDLRTETRDRRVDKVCIAVALLKARFPTLEAVPLCFLRFIAHTSFRYGVRSIAHIVDLIVSTSVDKKSLKLAAKDMPMMREDKLRESSLRLHLLDKDRAFGIVNRWNEFSKESAMVSLTATSVPVEAAEFARSFIMPAIKAGVETAKIIGRMVDK